jgi:hypothetical protein
MGETPVTAARPIFGVAFALLAGACTQDAGPSSGPAPSAPASTAAVAATPSVASFVPESREDALAKDIAADMPFVLGRVGNKPERTRVVDGFLLVDVDAGAATLAKCAELAQRFMKVMLDGRLYEPPYKAAIVWLFGTTERYDPYRHELAPGIGDTPYGLYDPTRQMIFVNLESAGIFTESHEMTHMLLAHDFPLAPVWLVEGMASLYELPDFDSEPGQAHGKPDFRGDVLRKALGDPRLARSVRLDVLFDMGDADFHGKARESLHYAMARETMRWLDTQGKLWPFYRGWRDGELDDVGGDKTFTKVMGKTPAAATEEWLAWVKGGNETGAKR